MKWQVRMACANGRSIACGIGDYTDKSMAIDCADELRHCGYVVEVVQFDFSGAHTVY